VADKGGRAVRGDEQRVIQPAQLHILEERRQFLFSDASGTIAVF